MRARGTLSSGGFCITAGSDMVLGMSFPVTVCVHSLLSILTMTINQVATAVERIVLLSVAI